MNVQSHPDSLSRGGVQEERGLCMHQYTIIIHIIIYRFRDLSQGMYMHNKLIEKQACEKSLYFV